MSSAPLDPKRHAMKCCKIRIEHSIYPPCKLKIRQGTTCLDVLSSLGLTEDYLLSTISDPQKQYTSEEVLYELIESDAKLVAKLSPEAEAKYAKLFMK
jgi:hypothetical protein